MLITEKIDGIGRVKMNRPDALNALNTQIIGALADVLESWDMDPDVRCIIIAGHTKAFAAGADIKEMMDLTPSEWIQTQYFKDWKRIRQIQKPLIAEVSGFALGGGCELAMSCDCIVASETAVFGQPEIQLGVIPGAGGTQRLTRALGKAKAMEMILTGSTIKAQEAYRLGLINRVVPVNELELSTMQLATSIASQSPLALRLAKQAILATAEIGFHEGLQLEQSNFYLLFSTEDQREGFQAFLEKRNPKFRGK